MSREADRSGTEGVPPAARSHDGPPLLPEWLARSFNAFDSQRAITVGGETRTYGELAYAAGVGAAHLEAAAPSSFVAVFGYRSLQVYEAVLATLLAGRAYVPLHPEFPSERTAAMLDRSGADILWLCPEVHSLADAVLSLMRRPLHVLGDFDTATRRRWTAQYPHHTFIPLSPSVVPRYEPVPVAADAPAYLLFTSGSTGTPKGVVVRHGNVRAYLKSVIERYGVGPGDRSSQTFDLTFDLSVHDMFVTWCSGAELHVLPKAAVMAPASFIRQHELTLWFSVPSVAMFMQRLRSLKPNSLPSLRCSLFCGEALPRTLAEAWQAAAPNSIVENLYGPTEATIAFTAYTWRSETSPAECRRGLVPIGTALPGQQTRIVPLEGDRAEKPTTAGELWLAGTQVTSGYLDDPERTEERYVLDADAPGGRWYRTGDLVTEDSAGCLHFVGRVDSQVQVLGHRVELSEIDHALREAADTELAVAVAWPIENGTAQGICAVVAADAVAADAASDTDTIRRHIVDVCRRKLPDYMVPNRIEFVRHFPLNANGKIDRKALLDQLGDRRHEAA